MPRVPIQQKLENVVAFIRNYNAQQGFPPALSEIAAGCDCSLNAAFRYRKRLEQQGRVRYIPGRARSVRVIDPPSNMKHIVERIDT